MPDDAPIRVLIVDDHPIVREGLRAFLESRQGIAVIGEAGDGQAAVTEAARLRPDVVLMDLVMPGGGGVEAIRHIQEGADPPRVLVLTSFANDEQVLPAVRAGASGYVLKDVAPADLETAIRTVHRGGALLDPHVAAAVMRQVGPGLGEPRIEDLTRREREVLRLVARGMSNREVATTLFVSEKTVKTHMSSILAKLRLNDRTQAALFAVRYGLGGELESGS